LAENKSGKKWPFLAKDFSAITTVAEKKLKEFLVLEPRSHHSTTPALSTSTSITTMAPEEEKKDRDSRWTKAAKARQHHFR
jgi:hypothetical protein